MIEFDKEVKFILGRPNFTCGSIAQILRNKGEEIATKAEDEQAHVIYWMLTMYEEHGETWKTKAEEYLREGV